MRDGFPDILAVGLGLAAPVAPYLSSCPPAPKSGPRIFKFAGEPNGS
jgi:hypothetical protein